MTDQSLRITLDSRLGHKINKKEPLHEELEAFAAAVRTHGPPPVRGESGLLALTVAQQLVESGTLGATLAVDGAPSSSWAQSTPLTAEANMSASVQFSQEGH